MKWKLFRLFLPLLIIGFVMPMIMPGLDGKPMMSWRDWLPSQSGLDQLRSTLQGGGEVTGPDSEPSPSAGLFKEKRLYQWRDTQGQWHFSDSPNPLSRSTVGKPLPVISNVMEPVELPGAQQQESSSVTGGFKFSPTTVPVEAIPRMIDDALNIQKLYDQYAGQLEDI